MSSIYSALNISHMNVKQLKKAAVDTGVDPVLVYTTVNQNKNDNSNGKNALITAIKAR